MRDFKKYDIWKDSMKLVKEIYQFSSSLPKEEKFGLISQMCRAAFLYLLILLKVQAETVISNLRDFWK